MAVAKAKAKASSAGPVKPKSAGAPVAANAKGRTSEASVSVSTADDQTPADSPTESTSGSVSVSTVGEGRVKDRRSANESAKPSLEDRLRKKYNVAKVEGVGKVDTGIKKHSVLREFPPGELETQLLQNVSLV